MIYTPDWTLLDQVITKSNSVFKQKDSYQEANWILLDYGDVVVHLFDKENRRFYDLERIWMDGKLTSAEDLKAE